MVSKLIAVLIALVIGLALLPVLNDFATDMTAPAVTAVGGSTLTTAGQYYGTTVGSLIDILPILFVIILVAGAVGYVVISSRKA